MSHITTPQRLAPTGLRRGTALFAACCALAGTTALGVLGTSRPAGAETAEECRERLEREGKSSIEALATCSRLQTPQSTTATTKADTRTPVLDRDSDDDSGTSPVALVLAAVVGAAVGAGAVVALRRNAPAAPASHTAPVSPTVSAAEEQRTQLVAGLIELRDSVNSDALRGDIAQRLRRVGVEEWVLAEGDVFDPAQHRGVDTRPSPTPEWDGRVAETERPGYVDRGSVLRPPDVVVFRT
jgi:hypothetical protein